jgi:hypothetical protein
LTGFEFIHARADGKNCEVRERAHLRERAAEAAAARGFHFDTVARERGHFLAVSFADVGGTGPEQRSIEKRHAAILVISAV